MRQFFSILMLAVASVASVTGTVQAADKASTVQVSIFNYKFDAETVTVPVGTTVTWTNKDEIPHTVASSDQAFPASPGLDTGDTYSYTFTKPGTYSYYCTLHPFMKGKVVVTPAIPAGD
jgi:amicyanin